MYKYLKIHTSSSTLQVRPHGQKFNRRTWYNIVVRHKTCRGCGSVDSIRDVCRVSCDILCCATKIVNRQMSVHFKRNLCDIMISQRCCVLSEVIWTYFCHFLRCSRAEFIKKIVDVWTSVAQLFSWPRHFLCRTTLLYNCCPCGPTLKPTLQNKTGFLLLQLTTYWGAVYKTWVFRRPGTERAGSSKNQFFPPLKLTTLASIFIIEKLLSN